MSLGHSEDMRMRFADDERCVALNLKGKRCKLKRRLEDLCVSHYKKKQRYKVETIRI